MMMLQHRWSIYDYVSAETLRRTTLDLNISNPGRLTPAPYLVSTYVVGSIAYVGSKVAVPHLTTIQILLGSTS